MQPFIVKVGLLFIAVRKHYRQILRNNNRVKNGGSIQEIDVNYSTVVKSQTIF